MESVIILNKHTVLNSLKAIILLGLIAGCSNQPSAIEDKSKLSVVSSTTIVGDVVSQIVGDYANTSTLLPAGADPHRFDPSPAEARMIADADILFVNGVGLDTFVLDLVPTGESAPLVIDLSENIPLIGIANPGEDEADDHDHEWDKDPHVWLDPGNVILWVEQINSGMQRMDPANGEMYKTNAENYIVELTALDALIQSEVAKIPIASRLLVTDHDSLGYFASAYGFSIVGFVVPGYSTLAQPSAQDMAALIELIRASSVPVIFVDPTFNAGLAEAVGKDAGVDVVPLYTGSLSPIDGPAATYLELMTANIMAIRENLVGK